MASLGFFNRHKAAAVEGRQAENQLFKIVAEELRAHIRDEGLWLQAFSKADGNEAATEAKYIKLRIQQLKDEAELEHLQRGEKLQITPLSEGQKALLELNKGSLPRKKLEQIIEKWDRRPNKNMKKILRDIRRANRAMSARALLMAGIIFGILIYAIPYISEN